MRSPQKNSIEDYSVVGPNDAESWAEFNVDLLVEEFVDAESPPEVLLDLALISENLTVSDNWIEVHTGHGAVVHFDLLYYNLGQGEKNGWTDEQFPAGLS